MANSRRLVFPDMVLLPLLVVPWFVWAVLIETVPGWALAAVAVYLVGVTVYLVRQSPRVRRARRAGHAAPSPGQPRSIASRPKPTLLERARALLVALLLGAPVILAIVGYELADWGLITLASGVYLLLGAVLLVALLRQAPAK
jgi:hypothetical protein